MRPDLAASDSIFVSTTDGGELKLLRLAGHAGPVVLVLHANGFHIGCYAPLVSHSPPAVACERKARQTDIMLPAQAWRIAKGGYQCWGLEFRSQGGTAAPPGNLVDVYLRDLLCVMEKLSLRGTYAGSAPQPEFSCFACGIV